MADEKQCGAQVETGDERTLTCVLPDGHAGPVHEAQDGEQWGDTDLPLEEPSA